MPSKYTVKVRIYHFVAVPTPVTSQVEIRKVVPELSLTYITLLYWNHLKMMFEGSNPQYILHYLKSV